MHEYTWTRKTDKGSRLLEIFPRVALNTVFCDQIVTCGLYNAASQRRHILSQDYRKDLAGYLRILDDPLKSQLIFLGKETASVGSLKGCNRMVMGSLVQASSHFVTKRCFVLLTAEADTLRRKPFRSRARARHFDAALSYSIGMDISLAYCKLVSHSSSFQSADNSMPVSSNETGETKER